MLDKWFGSEDVVIHARPQWLNGLELDFVVMSRKLVIEAQGTQHYLWCPEFETLDKHLRQKENDRRKVALCEQNGYKVVWTQAPTDLRDGIEYKLGGLRLPPLNGPLQNDMHNYAVVAHAKRNERVGFKVKSDNKLVPINAVSSAWLHSHHPEMEDRKAAPPPPAAKHVEASYPKSGTEHGSAYWNKMLAYFPKMLPFLGEAQQYKSFKIWCFAHPQHALACIPRNSLPLKFKKRFGKGRKAKNL